MIQKVFTVYDSKAEIYLKPFHMNSRGEAVRAFGDASLDEKTQIAKHPEDFTLFEIGEFDDSNGEYRMLNAKVSLGNALELKSRVN